MASRTVVFDHFCGPLAELDIATTPRSWLLNEFGQAEFTVSLRDPKCTRANLEFGNMLHIEHLPSDGRGKLPDWVGMILPPRVWDEKMVHVMGYSAEVVLAFRAMPFVKIVGTPATMFRQILNFARQAASNIVIHPGVVEDLPQQFSDDLSLSAYDHIQSLVNDAGMDWDVTGEIDERGRLKLYGNLYRRRGSRTDLVLTNLNTELAAPLLREEGTPANQVFGYTDAWTKQSRIKVLGENIDAISDYGPLQTNQVFVGKHDESSVKAAATNFAMVNGRPMKKIRRIILDREDTFFKTEVGNVVSVRNATAGFAAGGGFGFEAEARITAVDYNDLTNNAPVNLEIEDA